MNTDNIIPVEYINEARVTTVITRTRNKLLNEKNLPVAKISTKFPVIPEKEYTHYRIRIRFFRDDNKENYIFLAILILLYLFIIYYVNIKRYFL
tara:strand:- start:462 stop:743 length:282 start_codon:yes stop_codon:yes gene_type:complete